MSPTMAHSGEDEASPSTELLSTVRAVKEVELAK